MVEEADASFDLAATFTIQPDINLDLRLFGDSVNLGMSVTLGQLASSDSFPAQRFTLIVQCSPWMPIFSANCISVSRSPIT